MRCKALVSLKGSVISDKLWDNVLLSEKCVGISHLFDFCIFPQLKRESEMMFNQPVVSVTQLLSSSSFLSKTY